MKRVVLATVLLALGAAWGVSVYQAAVRDREYQALLRTGDTALLGEQTVEAIEAYSGAIALKPNSMLGHLRRGETYIQRGDMDAAARDFQTAASIDQSAPRPLDRLGDVRYRQGRFARAAELYESRLRLDDRSSAVTYKLALARYRAGNLTTAVAALERLIQMDEHATEGLYLLALCLSEQQQPAEAARVLEKTVALAPGMVPAREELAEIYGRLGRRVDQLAQLQSLVDADGARVERVIALGLAYAGLGHFDLAVLTLRKALENSAEQPAVYAAIGEVWLEAAGAGGDRTALSKAVEALERVATAPGATSHTLTLYGRALAATNQTENAERVFLQAIQRFPVSPSAFAEYANVAERHGRLDAARDALVRYDALTSDTQGPADAAARAARIATLSTRLGEPATAALWSQRAASVPLGGTADLGQASAAAGPSRSEPADPRTDRTGR